MNTNPENKATPSVLRIPAEVPPAFELSQPFRQSLPSEIQQWLDEIEQRIDGLTLEAIEELAALEASDQLKLGNDDDEYAKCVGERLYRLGRRLFYVRCQQIVDFKFPGMGIEFGIDLLWPQTVNDLPGSAVTTAVVNGEGLNTGCLRQLEHAGFALGGSSLM